MLSLGFRQNGVDVSGQLSDERDSSEKLPGKVDSDWKNIHFRAALCQHLGRATCLEGPCSWLPALFAPDAALGQWGAGFLSL